MLHVSLIIFVSIVPIVFSFFHGVGPSFFHHKIASVRSTVKPDQTPAPKKKWNKVLDTELQIKPTFPGRSYIINKQREYEPWRGKGMITFEDGGNYDGEWKNGKKHGQGKETSACGHVVEGEFKHNLPFNAHGARVVDNGTAVFEGTWINGTRSGPGRLVYLDLNQSLEGEFKGDSIYNGKGVLRFKDGSTQEGTFVNRTLSGPGKVTNRTGTVYEGNFERGVLHGYGKETHKSGVTLEGYFDHWNRVNGTQRFADGTTYSGTFYKQAFHGYGTITYANGESYKGEWVNGSREGKGKFVFLNNATYEGDWKHNRAEGNGTYVGRDYTYTGNHIKDLKTGYGVIRYVNGDSYEGMCFNGTRHGQGKRISAEGHVCEGEFFMGRLCHGKGALKDSNGSLFEGTWHNFKNEGRTKRMDADGGVFVGEYRRGKENGPGTMTYADGSVYEGEWQGGLRHGTGKFTSASGEVQEGKFRLDTFVPEVYNAVL